MNNFKDLTNCEYQFCFFECKVIFVSGGELLEMQLLDSHLLDTFGSKSIARHEIDKLLESSKSWINLIRTDDQNIVICSNPVFI